MQPNKDLQSIRSDFSILHETVHGQPLIYLDNAATGQKPKEVIDAVSDYYKRYNSNVHRGVHELSQRATDLYESARSAVRQFINARFDDEIIFTRGTTESLNLAAHSLGKLLLKPGDEIVVTEMEHHSNFVPWQMLATFAGARFKVIRLTDEGSISMDEFKAQLTSRTKIVALTHASNTLGTINPIKEMTALAKAVGATVVIDGAQFIPHLPVNVQDLDCDLYAFSAHKLFGPTGIGVLYGKKELLDRMPPYQYGGGMIGEVSIEETTFANAPQVFEAGTPNIAGAHGLTAAIRYINTVGYDFIHQHENDLLAYAEERMKNIRGMKFIGSAPDKVSLISFVIEGLHPFDIGTLLDQMGIAVRTGHHCTQPIMTRYGITGTVRASFAFYNTKDEIDKLVEGIEKSISILS